MTDKEIIIDGVDVSGCDHYRNGTCLLHYLLTDMAFCEAKCKLTSNCYYKQLARLQTQYNEVVAQNKSLQKYVRELEEKLKEVK